MTYLEAMWSARRTIWREPERRVLADGSVLGLEGPPGGSPRRNQGSNFSKSRTQRILVAPALPSGRYSWQLLLPPRLLQFQLVSKDCQDRRCMAVYQTPCNQQTDLVRVVPSPLHLSPHWDREMLCAKRNAAKCQQSAA